MRGSFTIALLLIAVIGQTMAQQNQTLSIYSEENRVVGDYTTSIKCLGVTAQNDPYINESDFRQNWFSANYDDSWWDAPEKLPAGWCPTCGLWPRVWGINSNAIPIWASLDPDSLDESGVYVRHKYYMPNCTVDSAKLYLSIDDDIFIPNTAYPTGYHGMRLAGEQIDLSNYDYPNQHEEKIVVRLTSAQLQGLSYGAENLITFYARDGWRKLNRCVRYEIRFWMECNTIMPTWCQDTVDIFLCWDPQVDDQFLGLTDPVQLIAGGVSPVNYSNGAYHHWGGIPGDVAAQWESDPGYGILGRVKSTANYSPGSSTMATYCDPHSSYYGDQWFDTIISVQDSLGQQVTTSSADYFMTGVIEPHSWGTNIWYGPFLQLEINDNTQSTYYYSGFSYILPQDVPVDGGILQQPFRVASAYNTLTSTALWDSTRFVDDAPMRFCAEYKILFTEFDESSRTVKMNIIGDITWVRYQDTFVLDMSGSATLTLSPPFSIEHIRGLINHAGIANYGDIWVGRK